ncbi:ABC transporter permease [Halorhabdus salina]|uniref:ABC transporter permease n=1 Tax=Halorhabdus salina TaxID=2750670 RepID=UPI0028683A72|nr:ABC transporter permease [Halorhabdus salina]
MSRTDVDSEYAFEVTAEETLSRRDRIRHRVDQFLLAPARILWTDWRARIGLVIIGLFLFLSLIGPSLVERPEPLGPLLAPPWPWGTLEYPLGTTYLGQSILSQLVHGAPNMLKMILSGALFTVIVATVIGTTAGYKGGTVDGVLMTISDIAMTIPGLPLVIILAASLPIAGNPYLIGILLSINAWAGLARSLRSQVLTLRESEYVEASRIMDISLTRILGIDIIPNLMPYIAMNFVQQARWVIFNSVALYFLGVLPYSSTNWGVMMNSAYQKAGAVTSLEAFHWLAVPMFAVVLVALGLTLLAQSADRLFNPRVRARHAETVTGENGPEDEEESEPTTSVGAVS